MGLFSSVTSIFGGGGEGGGGSISPDKYMTAEQTRNVALRQAATWRQSTAFATALLSAYKMIDNFKKQKKLADRTWRISEDNHDRVTKKYFPKEEEFIAEFGFDGGIEVEPVEVYQKRYAGRLKATVANEYEKKIKELQCNASRYCKSAFAKAMMDLMQAKAFALTQAMIAGENLGFNEYQERKSKADKRRLEVAGLGKGLVDAYKKATALAQGALDANFNASAGHLKRSIGEIINADQARYRYDAYDLSARAGTGWNGATYYQNYLQQYRYDQSYAPMVGNTVNTQFKYYNYQTVNSMNDSLKGYTNFTNFSEDFNKSLSLNLENNYAPRYNTAFDNYFNVSDVGSLYSQGVPNFNHVTHDHMNLAHVTSAGG